jgi:hypothetical protein
LPRGKNLRKIFLIYGCYLAVLIAVAGVYTVGRINTAYATQAHLRTLAAELPSLAPRIRSGDRAAAHRCLALLDSAVAGLPSLRAKDSASLAPRLDAIRAGCARVAVSAAMVPPEP